MTHTYSDVDASADPARAAAWQEVMSSWPAVRAYKQRTYDLLADARPVVDVGCGPGVDLEHLAPGVMGIDASTTMLEAARRRAAVCRGDAHWLPFRDGVFGGARADRVLQHLADPTGALREMARVVHRNGLIVVADPDQESLVIAVPGVRARVVHRLKELRRDLGYRNGRFISQVPALFDTVGIELQSVDAYALTITDPADSFGLPSWPHVWRQDGPFSDDELAEWDAAIDDASIHGFVYAVTFFVVAGAKR